ncbi:MAG: helix-turn-helix transcriptional regulator [Clostridia bacterium]|nr:helix-turn-helix transcriptional regulator [Clostridia bacterium]
MSKIFGERLKELRIQEGLSQQAMAKLLGTSQASLSKWENDIQEPCIDEIVKICNALNVTCDYLLGRQDW